MGELNKTQEIANKRLEEIAYSEERIKGKIDKFPKNDPRQEGWAKRLKEYEVSKVALALELKSGTPVKIKDEKQMALVAVMAGGSVPEPTPGVAVDVPAGELKLESK